MEAPARLTPEICSQCLEWHCSLLSMWLHNVSKVSKVYVEKSQA